MLTGCWVFSLSTGAVSSHIPMMFLQRHMNSYERSLSVWASVPVCLHFVSFRREELGIVFDH
ncbi:hypothetical protein XSR1_200058 [Xenorhabdus szentirmaii DSM 16338]|uniref:Uncharacterized protein n=1 Tax=Xenorhabdus szentirmaii DSM 16338 TaxID=1427518 RepID=W1IVS3_9GAMM|nr:hypothetical protein XSR1_200058 [Xenorhabdus szentirmaii DSM 16338]